MHVTWELWNYGAEKVLRSLHYKLHHLFMNVSTFTSSHRFSLKNWTSVMLMHLGSPVHSPTSWVMKGGHSSKWTPSWSLGHSCGIVLLKSIISDGPLMAHLPDGSRGGSYLDRPVWKSVQKPFLQPEACFSGHSLIFMFLIPCIKFLFCFKYSERFLFPDKSTAWYTCTDSCNDNHHPTGKYYYPLFTIRKLRQRRLISLLKVPFRI